MKIILSLILFLLVAGCSHKNIETSGTQGDVANQDAGLDLDPEVKKKFVVKKKVGSVGSEAKQETTEDKNKKIATVDEGKVVLKTKKQARVETEKNTYPDSFPDKYKKYDEQYASVWKQFDPSYINKNEKITMRVSYLGLGMGKIHMLTGPKVLVGEKEAFSFDAKLETAAFYSYIYELNDKLSANVLTNSFLPLRYSLFQRESNKEIDDVQLFDRDKFMLYYRYRRWRKDKKALTKKKDDIFIPKFSIDPFTLLYFVRGLPLAVGKSFSFPVVTRNKLWIFKFKVSSKEKIKTRLGRRWAFKVDAEIGEEGSFIKKGALKLWFDVEAGHMLWQMKVGTKIGSLYSTVIEYDAGQSF